MKAILKFQNPKRGMYAAEILDSGEFVIFELLDSIELQEGDILQYDNFFNFGSGVFKNISQNCEFDVFIENICGKQDVNKQLLF